MKNNNNNIILYNNITILLTNARNIKKQSD